MHRTQREHCIVDHRPPLPAFDAPPCDASSSDSSILAFGALASASPASVRPAKTAAFSATPRCASLGAPSALAASSYTAASIIDLRSSSRVSFATDPHSRRGQCSAGATPVARTAGIRAEAAADGLHDDILLRDERDHRHDAFTAMWVSKHSPLASASAQQQARRPPPPQTAAPSERRPVRRTLSALTRELRSHDAQFERAPPPTGRIAAGHGGARHGDAFDASQPGWAFREAFVSDLASSLRRPGAGFAEGAPLPHTAPQNVITHDWQRGGPAPRRPESGDEAPLVLARPAFPVLATSPSDAPGLQPSAPAACTAARPEVAADAHSPPALAPIFQQMRAGPAVGLIFEELTVRTAPAHDAAPKRSIDGPATSERAPAVSVRHAGVRRAISMHQDAATEPPASESGKRARCLSDQPLAELSPFTSQNSSPVSGLLRPLIAAQEATDAPSTPFDLSDAELADGAGTPSRALAKSASTGAARRLHARSPAARERSARRGRPPLSPPLDTWRQLAAQAAAADFASDELEDFCLAPRAGGAEWAPATADARVTVSCASTASTPRARAAPPSPSCKSAPLPPLPRDSSRPGDRPSPIALVLAAQTLMRGGERDSSCDSSDRFSAGSVEPVLALSRAPSSGSADSTPKQRAAVSPFDVADGTFPPGPRADGRLQALFDSHGALAQLKVPAASGTSSALASPLAGTPKRVSSLTLALKAYSTESTVLAAWDPASGSCQHVADAAHDEAPPPWERAPTQPGGVAQHVSCPVTPITQSRRGSRASLVHPTFLVTVDTGDLDSGLSEAAAGVAVR